MRKLQRFVRRPGGYPARTMTDPSKTSHIEAYLRDVEFPAPKERVVEAARRREAPASLLHALESLPDASYSGPEAVRAALADVLEEIDDELDD